MERKTIFSYRKVNEQNYIIGYVDTDQHVFSKRGFKLETDIHVHV